MRSDYHTHLENYGLTRDSLIRLIDSARAAGVAEIGLTEHAYHFVQCRTIYPRDNPWIHNSSQTLHHDWDLETYVQLLEVARDEGLPVKMGMEWDYCRGYEEPLDQLIRDYDWDFTLGSVHWLSRPSGGWWGFDIADQAEEWDRRSVAAVYAEYFRVLSEAASTRFFDILAHLDVVKVFGHRPEGDLSPVYDQITEVVARSGACVEVSTAGWRKRVGELYPAPTLLLRLHRQHVPVVISSDAHFADEIGFGFTRAESIVRETGYATRCMFTRRIRTDMPLEAPSPAP